MPVTRIERILAVTIVILIVLALGCFIAVIAATALGAAEGDTLNHGIWPAVFFVQYYGLPLAFLLVIVLLATNALRRSRAARKSEQ